MTIAGSIINFLLVIFKFIAGVTANSAAMIADATHSLSDFITDIIVLIFVRVSNKPEDKTHDYGHGKFETLATAIIGIALFIVGFGICYNGISEIVSYCSGTKIKTPGMLAFWAAIISIVSKEYAYQFTVHAGRKYKSPSVEANAWHHRSDALSSIGTAIGIGGAILLGDGWQVLDPIAAVVVSFFIMKVAYKLLKPCVNELLERSLPDDVEAEITRMVQEEEGVSQMHHLRTRRIGGNYAIEMHIRMDGQTTLNEAHRKATGIEHRLKNAYGEQTHVGIHVEPLKIDGHYADIDLYEK